MNRRLAAARLITLLCLMALLVMQAVGGFRAYICDCGGQVTLTNVDHCHGPHSADCHEQKSETSRQHDESSGDREDHEQIVQELKMRSVETIQIPVVIPLLLTWLPAAVGTMEEWGRNANCQSVIERDPAAAPGVVVARTVVFII